MATLWHRVDLALNLLEALVLRERVGTFAAFPSTHVRW